MKSILIVDHDSAGERLGDALADQGYRSAVAHDARTATSILQSGMPVDIVITETRLPDTDGLKFLAWLHRTHPALPVIVVTAECSVEHYVRAASLGVLEFLIKPVHLKDFYRVVGIALRPPGEYRGITHGPNVINGRADLTTS